MRANIVITLLLILCVEFMREGWALRPQLGNRAAESSGGLLSRAAQRKRRRQSSSIKASGIDLLFQDNVAAEMVQSGPTTTLPSGYEYVPPEVGAEIYVGSIVALVPIVWATYEFTNRIRIQQQCLVCAGSGLVSFTKSGTELKRQRKCYNCGGFLPWLGWKAFFLSTFTDIGNGGVLQQPSKDYRKNNALIDEQRLAEGSEQSPEPTSEQQTVDTE